MRYGANSGVIMFVVGFIAGLFVGANVGLLVAGLLFAANKGDTAIALEEKASHSKAGDKISKVMPRALP